jgi:predicted Fe-S protein YdhL (DUF1289 family)
MARPFPVPSPCVGVCKLDLGTQICRGCGRTGVEIAEWSVSDDAEKLEINRKACLRRLDGAHLVRTEGPQ